MVVNGAFRFTIAEDEWRMGEETKIVDDVSVCGQDNCAKL